MSLTTSQVMELAPDSSSLKAGQDLAKAHKWLTLGVDGQVTWGEIKGSGAVPYRTTFDMSGTTPAYKCSCPSRKFPCKHGLGLMLIQSAASGTFKAGSPPDWVAAWVTSRAARIVAAENPKPVDEATQAKRLHAREDKVDAGIAELRIWMDDLARRGIASAKSEPFDFWDRMGGRLVDAQAPGLARRVRSLGSAISQPGDAVLVEIGRIELLLRAWPRIDLLTDGLKADLRTAVGFNTAAADVLHGVGVLDTWTVLAHRFDESEDKIRERSAWLFGRDTGRFAVIVDYAAGDRPMPAVPAPGQAFSGEVAYFPGDTAMRALIKGETTPSKASQSLLQGVHTALETVAAAVASVPWLESVPVALGGVRFGMMGTPSRLAVGDGELALPLADMSSNPGLVSVAGGAEVDLFGLWDGRRLVPLALWHGGSLYTAPSKVGVTAVRKVA